MLFLKDIALLRKKGMTFDSAKFARKMIGLILAILCYYIIHEGAHLLFALSTGTFEEIVFIFPGIQIKADTERLNIIQIFVFCLLGAVAALTVAYILCGISRVVEKNKKQCDKSNSVLYHDCFAPHRSDISVDIMRIFGRR